VTLHTTHPINIIEDTNRCFFRLEPYTPNQVRWMPGGASSTEYRFWNGSEAVARNASELFGASALLFDVATPTLHPIPYTLNPQPSTLNPKP